MTWKIQYLKSSKKWAKRLSPEHRKKVRVFLEQRLAHMDDPRRLGKALKGELAQYWRYRLGDIRIICQIQEQNLLILVIRFGQRKDIYRS